MKPRNTILLFCALLASSAGCAVVGIPSYRADIQGGYCQDAGQECVPGIIPPRPPLPKWLARWKAEKDLPSPPEYPRFHPIPTRPMFSPEPTMSMEGVPPFVESMENDGARPYGEFSGEQSW